MTCFATSLGPDPETSIKVLEKSACAGGYLKGGVERSVDEVEDGFFDGAQRRHVIHDTGSGCELGESPMGSIITSVSTQTILQCEAAYLPDTKKLES